MSTGLIWFVVTRPLSLSSCYEAPFSSVMRPAFCDPSLARIMQEKIAGSRLVILPNSGHLAFQDQPKLWIETVRDFVNDADTKRSCT